ncbi:hypothetical protein IE81DRAFT_221968 [Ceraceosorus guamensis]|uniref:Uncharacterized protein n=1 Tax=Ceraceosorus guamensis TaxID=1522189 RepID=A0A316VY64_9BASI|nr:hypothetical protein IE81DRAFT_221968 [Ceraceosorus guamensis]PWN40415.1 hypothetical protein IE81DRAFT_221968 [Ceraceosorus guamensis]
MHAACMSSRGCFLLHHAPTPARGRPRGSKTTTMITRSLLLLLTALPDALDWSHGLVYAADRGRRGGVGGGNRMQAFPKHSEPFQTTSSASHIPRPFSQDEHAQQQALTRR